MSYQAPIKEISFVINHLAQLEDAARLPGTERADADTIAAVLDEAAKFAERVLSPLNVTGDKQPSEWVEGEVISSLGFKEAFHEFASGGWQGVHHPEEFGGQSLPKLLATACSEMFDAANLSFALIPLLTDGAIEALLTAGSPELREQFIPKLISGDFTGTMNLTEPQAGSDLALLRTRAVPQGDASYKIYGTKIFITWGEHDLAENIVHLVLARTPTAPEGVKGISLFVVPKFVLNADGSNGPRNDVRCVSIEHKLGIKASPTAVLQFGDNGGAVGYLVGEENRGLEYMFIMMNAARFGVGLEGIGISERAYQKALGYAKERVQSRPVDGSARHSVAIVLHPDVRRMLATMRSLTEGARGLAYVAAAHYDVAHGHADEETRKRHLEIYEFLVPVVKGWSTEMSLAVTSLGVQVHGGMGFIEETGAAQYYRDARILPIYEGTTAIQANDLVGRKTIRDSGAVALDLVQRIESTIAQLSGVVATTHQPAINEMLEQLEKANLAFEKVVKIMVGRHKEDPNGVYASAVYYLRLAGLLLSGWQLARSMVVAIKNFDQDSSFYSAKLATGQFFAKHLLPETQALHIAIVGSNGKDGYLRSELSYF
jgi:alkylation response protein AidB-like acyl-CoA dehydrogenase